MNKIADLDQAALKGLLTELDGVESPENILLYLKFMGAKDPEAALAS